MDLLRFFSRWTGNRRADQNATPWTGTVAQTRTQPPEQPRLALICLNRHDGEVEHDGEVGGFAGGDPRGCHLVNRGEDVVHVAARADDVVAPADHLRVTACTGMRDT